MASFVQAIRIGAMAGVLTALPACSSRPSFHEEIERANEELVERFNTGDYAGVAAMYLDNAVLLGPDGYKVEGREAINRYWDHEWVNADWQLFVFDVEGTESMPVQHGRSILKYDRNGEPRVSDVRFILIWRRHESGEYRIAADVYW